MLGIMREWSSQVLVETAEARLNKLGKHDRKEVVKMIKKNQKRLVKRKVTGSAAKSLRARIRQSRRAENRAYRMGEISMMKDIYEGNTHVPTYSRNSEKARKQFHRGRQRSADNFLY